MEIDTIAGPENKGAILTATERKTAFLLMKTLPNGKNAKAPAKELFLMMPYKNSFIPSLPIMAANFMNIRKLLKNRMPNIILHIIFLMGAGTE